MIRVSDCFLFSTAKIASLGLEACKFHGAGKYNCLEGSPRITKRVVREHRSVHRFDKLTALRLSTGGDEPSSKSVMRKCVPNPAESVRGEP